VKLPIEKIYGTSFIRVPILRLACIGPNSMPAFPAIHSWTAGEDYAGTWRIAPTSWRHVESQSTPTQILLSILPFMQVERDVKDIVQSLVSQEGPYTVERYNVGPV
jgi:hypothetical protein